MRSRNGKSLRVAGLISGAVLAAAPGAARAVDRYWTGGSGSWDDTTHWAASEGGAGGQAQPAAGGSIYVSQSSNDPLTLTYKSAVATSVGTLHLDYLRSGTGEVRLEIGQDMLSLNTLLAGESVGSSGRIVHSGGTNLVITLYLASKAGGSFGYELSGTGVLLGGFNAVYVGNGGTATFAQSGGLNNSFGVFVGGQTAAQSASIGTYTLSGGTARLGDLFVGGYGNGTFNQSGGTLSSTVTVAGGLTGSTFNLSGQGVANLADLAIGGKTNATSGFGTFNQDGGSLTIGPSSVLNVRGKGTFNLKSGPVQSTTANVGNSSPIDQGVAAFNQTGGTNTVNGTLTVFTNGTYNLEGGSLSVGKTPPTPAAAQLVNAGKFNFKGGAIDTPKFVNQSQATADISAGVTVNLPGDLVVAANSKFRNNGGTLSVAGTTTVDGGLISDPATNTFGNLVVNPNGYVQGGAGDVFKVLGNFDGHSANLGVWNTTGAELRFEGSASHLLKTGALDLGFGAAGWSNNYSWQVLALAAGESLTLGDGDLVPGAAVYTRAFQLGGGLGQVGSITGNGVNIYYDVADPANAYLGGGTYPFTGGGALLPNTPEPAGWVLAAAGAGALGLSRRRVRRRGGFVAA